MVNLSLVEIKSKKIVKPKNENYQSRSFLSPSDSYGFVMNFVQNISSETDKTQLEVDDVTNKISQGKYNLNSDFTIIYLYDYFNDSESRDFISVYGGKLHNKSSSNLSILTYYSQEMAENWTNVAHREKLEFGPEIEKRTYNALQIVDDLKKAYDVKTLPAMVIVKKDSKENEESCIVNLAGYKKDNIFNVFNEVIEIITDNCEENFSVISNKICGPDNNIRKCNNISNINTYYYVADLVKAKSKNTYNGYTQDDLAAELCMDVRTLRNRRNNNTFTRDECFYLAIKFEISIQELNDLLRANNQLDLGMSGRDGIIRKSLYCGYDVIKTNDELLRNGYNGIIKDDDYE